MTDVAYRLRLFCGTTLLTKLVKYAIFRSQSERFTLQSTRCFPIYRGLTFTESKEGNPMTQRTLFIPTLFLITLLGGCSTPTSVEPPIAPSASQLAPVFIMSLTAPKPVCRHMAICHAKLDRENSVPYDMHWAHTHAFKCSKDIAPQRLLGPEPEVTIGTTKLDTPIYKVKIRGNKDRGYDTVFGLRKRKLKPASQKEMPKNVKVMEKPTTKKKTKKQLGGDTLLQASDREGVYTLKLNASLVERLIPTLEPWALGLAAFCLMALALMLGFVHQVARSMGNFVHRLLFGSDETEKDEPKPVAMTPVEAPRKGPDCTPAPTGLHKALSEKPQIKPDDKKLDSLDHSLCEE